jgi:hypothetical protein
MEIVRGHARPGEALEDLMHVTDTTFFGGKFGAVVPNGAPSRDDGFTVPHTG